MFKNHTQLKMDVSSKKKKKSERYYLQLRQNTTKQLFTFTSEMDCVCLKQTNKQTNINGIKSIYQFWDANTKRIFTSISTI